MRLHIRRRGVEVSEKLRMHVWSSLRAALGRFARYVSDVWVYLRDVNGPRGGVDRKCRIVVSVPPIDRVVVAGEHAKIRVAIKTSADRARLAVIRHVKRRLALRRRASRRAGVGRRRCAGIVGREAPGPRSRRTRAHRLAAGGRR